MKKFFFIVFSIFLSYSCSQDDISNESSVAKYEFLVVGIDTGERNPSTTSALFYDTNAMKPLAQEGIINRANEVLKIGNDVYIGGIQLNVNGQNKIGYWKNGVFTTIAQTNDYINYGGLAIVNGNIYLAASLNRKVKVWKNGVEITTFATLSTSNSQAEINDIFVTNDEQVYICGKVEQPYNTSTADFSFIGKIGDVLSIGDRSKTASKIVYGNTTYAIGIDYSVSYNKAQLWQNTVPISLPASKNVSIAYNVKEIDNSLYIVGETHDRISGGYLPLYWKDRVVNQLPLPDGMEAEAVDIQQLDGHIFILGRLIGDNGYERPIIWKDGEIVEIPATLNGIKYATAFQVVRN